MSLIRHSFFPRSAFDMDYWLRPSALDIDIPISTLDMFDPFDELDRVMGRNLMWLDVPDILKNVTPIVPRVPKKFRITVNCKGFNPNSIKTEVSDDKKTLVVVGHQGSAAAKEGEDYTLREFRKTYKLPDSVETDKLVSFMTSNGRLVIEIPQRREEKEDEFPRLVDEKGDQKRVEWNMWMPKSIDPTKIKVTCKDRDLIVQGEDKQEKEDELSHVYYYRRTTLPENTNFNQLKCTWDNNQLKVTAPLDVNLKQIENRTIPVELASKKQESLTSGKQTGKSGENLAGSKQKVPVEK